MQHGCRTHSTGVTAPCLKQVLPLRRGSARTLSSPARATGLITGGAKTNQTAQDVASAAMLKVSQMTDVLKAAIAHDKNVRSVMSNEIDAKMRQVKSSGLVKQKNIEIRELKNEEDAKLKVLEKQREVKKIEASSKDKKADAKIDKKLEKEKEKRLGIKLKAKLLEAEDGVRADNLRLKEKEEAKNLKSKESDFKVRA